MDHYADDLADTAHLDLHNAVHIGHSTGGGEVSITSPDTVTVAWRKLSSSVRCHH